MKILLTGASGLVGAAFAPLAARAGHEVTGITGRWSETVPGTVGLLARDLTDPAAAAALVRGIRPDAIVNAAALSEPAACAAAPERAQRLNVDFPAALAAAASAAGARFVHISTEQVFDGEHAPYVRTASAQPLNLYGRQKLASEQAVRAADRRAAVVRAPLLFGNSPGGRRSVHEKLFEQWAAGRVARLYTDEVRQVCTAENFAAVLLALAARRDLAGVFQWAGAERVTRWDMGRSICTHFGVAEKWIEPMTRAENPEAAAARPRDLSLDVTPLDCELGVPRPTLADCTRGLIRPQWAETLLL